MDTTKPKRGRLPAPLSLRLTPEERKILETAAQQGRFPTISAYIRARLFGQFADINLSSIERPSSKLAHYQLFARALSKLGELAVLRNLSDLAEAARIGVLPLTPDVLSNINAACAQIREMRDHLLRALGLKPDKNL